jgi:hypothetical protein
MDLSEEFILNIFTCAMLSDINKRQIKFTLAGIEKDEIIQENKNYIDNTNYLCGDHCGCFGD